MRALIVTNMYPTPARPALGSFVRDQVSALRRVPGVDVSVFCVAPGEYGGSSGSGLSGGPGLSGLSGLSGRYRRRGSHGRYGRYGRYGRAALALARAGRRERYDIVHAHFGLTAWPALAARAARRVVTLHGTDLSHPRSRAVSLAALRFYDLVAAVSEPLAATVPEWAVRREVAVLPAGVDVSRFHPMARADARAALGLDPDGRYLLFPADPARPEKRYDRAALVAGDVPLLTLGSIEPEQVPLWVNAANAVLVTSEREGFGLAVLEALACDVPVLATPVGVAPAALAGVAGTYCETFDAAGWRTAVAPHLATADPRVAGRARACEWSTDRMAERVVAAWRSLLA